MRRVTYLVCALLGVLAAVGIAFLPAGTTLDSVSGVSSIAVVNGSTSKINVLNSSTATATCTVVYTNSQGGAPVMAVPYTINKNSQITIDVSKDVESSFFGSAVVRWQAQTRLIIEHVNRYSSGPGNIAPGSDAPATTWGYPNGNTTETMSSEYSTYVYVQNPNETDVNCVVNNFGTGGFISQQSAIVGPGKIGKFAGYVNPGMNKIYGAFLQSNQPVVAAVQQYSYSDSSSGMHLGPLQNQGTTFYDPGFADPNGVSTFHVLNSNSSAANLTITYATTQGGQGTYQTVVSGQSKKDIGQSNLTNYAGNAVITTNIPTIVGRTYYWRVDEVNSVSQGNLAQDVWSFTGFTGGQTGGSYDTTHTVGNYNNAPVTGTIRYYKGGGQDPNIVQFEVPAKSSKRIKASATIPAGTFGTLFESNDASLRLSVVQHVFWNYKKYGSADSGVGYNNPIDMSVSGDNQYHAARKGATILEHSNSSFGVVFTPNASLSWSATANVPWIKELPSGSGSSPDLHYFTIDVTGMERGYYKGVITVTASGASNSPQYINVYLTIM